MSEQVDEFFDDEDAHELDELGLGTSDADEVHEVDVSSIDVNDIIAVSARLAHILAQEADLLEDMKVSKIAGLQEEKRLLTNALEAMKKQVAKDRSIVEDITQEERENLVNVVTVFNEILDENYRRLAMARAVNHKIVQAITEVAQESTKNDLYDRKGESNKTGMESVSVTLNEHV